MGSSSPSNTLKNNMAAGAQSTANTVTNRVSNPSPFDTSLVNYGTGLQNSATNAASQASDNYNSLMGGYSNLYNNLSANPISFKSSPNLTAAASGYSDFANTGGYSPSDIAALRQRATSPITASANDAIMNLNQARELGGAGGSPNYIAAVSALQRSQPQQLSDALTNANATIAQNVAQNKLAGNAGLAGIGTTESTGDLSAQEAQQGALQGTLSGATSLYGTTPAQANMFGNQALTAAGLNSSNENALTNEQLGLLNTQLYGTGVGQQTQGSPWWQTALGIAGTAAPYAAMAFSDKNMKKDISPIDSSDVIKGLKKLPLNTWKYKGDDSTHVGPMAQDVKKHLGIGDGHTMHLADIMGVMLSLSKELARKGAN